MKIQSTISHTIFGILWFDLPMGILLAFIYHNISRNSLFDNLPLPLKSRFAKFKTFNWNTYFLTNWHIIIISLLIGAFSHIFWDSFTHEHGYFVEAIPALTKIIPLYSKATPVFKILQHASTLLGGLAIIIVIFKLPSDNKIPGRINRNYWIILLFVALSIILIRIWSGLDYKQYGNLIVTAISSMMISLILTPIILIALTKAKKT